MDNTNTAPIDIKVKFNNYAIEQLSKLKGIDLDKIAYGFIAGVVWAGYCGYCFAQQIERQYTFDQINDWIDDPENNARIAEIHKEFEESKSYQRLIAPVQEQKKSENNPA